MKTLFIVLTIIGILTTLLAVAICKRKKEPYHPGQDESGEHDYEHEIWSGCCSAPIIYGDICSDCMEHCDEAEDEL